MILFFRQLGFPRCCQPNVRVSLEVIQRLEEQNSDLMHRIRRFERGETRVKGNEGTYGVLPQLVQDINRAVPDDFLRMQEAKAKRKETTLMRWYKCEHLTARGSTKPGENHPSRYTHLHHLIVVLKVLGKSPHHQLDLRVR